jgi:hypothetical protein
MNSTSSPPSSRWSWPPAFVGLFIGIASTYCYFTMQHARDASELAFARAERQKLLEEQKQGEARRQLFESRLARLEQTMAELESRRPRGDVMFTPAPMDRREAPQAGPPRPATFRNRQVKIFNEPLAGPTPGTPVTLPFPGTPGRRSWGHEQATGAPDTPEPGDRVTAWASREPDGGPEWLRLGFGKPVEIAEVRIRETYNPGAVSRVAAVVDGREQVVWEGTEDPAPAPRDFVVPAKDKVVAQTIVIYLDTARVPGWNEIDAVELVGKDGSRQWAETSAASSSFGDGQPPIAPEPVETVQPIPAPTRR